MRKYNLPDMSSDSRVFCTYIINGKHYGFRFTWCNTFFVLDIYTANSDGNKYILNSEPLVTGFDFLSRIKQPDIISGKLYLHNKFDEDYTPEPDSLSSDFELIYYAEDEAN